MSLHTLLRFTVFATLVGTLTLAGTARASGPRQDDAARVPITAGNAADVIEIGTVVESNFPVRQVVWLPDGSLVALSRDSIDQFPYEKVMLTPGPLAEQVPITLRTDIRMAAHPGGAQVAVLALVAHSINEQLVVEALTPEAAAFKSPALRVGTDRLGGALAFSPDGSRIIVTPRRGGDERLRVFDTELGQLVRVVDGFEWALDVIFVTEDTFAVAYGPAGVVVWALEADGLREVWRDATLPIDRLAVHDIVLVGSDPSGADDQGVVSAWNAMTGDLMWEQSIGPSQWSIAINPTGDVVATGGEDRMIYLWDAATGELLNTLVGATDDVVALAFSPDGTWLASGEGSLAGLAPYALRLWAVPAAPEPTPSPAGDAGANGSGPSGGPPEDGSGGPPDGGIVEGGPPAPGSERPPDGSIPPVPGGETE